LNFFYKAETFSLFYVYRINEGVKEVRLMEADDRRIREITRTAGRGLPEAVFSIAVKLLRKRF